MGKLSFNRTALLAGRAEIMVNHYLSAHDGGHQGYPMQNEAMNR